jgi:2-iminobutanoate/2-iminopropanoate deaminase
MAVSRSVIRTERAPQAVGPYAQGIRAGDLVFTAGQVAIDPTTGKIEATTIEGQTRQVLANLRAVVEAAGSGLDRVVKTTVFMVDLKEFAAMNEVYADFFPTQPPARSTVQVAALPLGARVEIECVAVVA